MIKHPPQHRPPRYYSGIIFENLSPGGGGEGAGGEEERALLLSLGVATAGMCSSLLSLLVIDRLGRRAVLIASSLGSVAGLVVVGLTFPQVCCGDTP